MKKNRESDVGGCVAGIIRKMFLMMRLTFLVWILAFSSVYGTVRSQVRISLSLKNATLQQVFEEIAKNTGYNFVYSRNIIEKAGRVTLDLKNEEIEKVLTACLKGTGLWYRLEDQLVLISPKFEQQGASQKHVEIRGVVCDKEGRVLVGATILLKGTTFGVSTNKDGKFILSLPERENMILVFSFVGMKSQEVAYTGQSEFSIRMEEDNKIIDEIVVTGYQNIRKSEMVGSTNTIKREDLFFDGTNSVEQMLQGKLPGTLVMNANGLVGSRQRVRVRGTSTLLSNPEPVWVVDGIIQDDPLPFKARELGSIGDDNFEMIKSFVGNGIGWLNPNDIEDITVLKDASATVLYGVKAANGVIVITTKRGKTGSMAVNYSGGVAITEKLNYGRMNLMNSKERIDVSREIYERRLLGLAPTESIGYENVLQRYLNKQIGYDEFNAEVKKLETVNTNWIDILYRAPLSHNHSLSFSGGGEKITYYASVHFNQNYGTAKGNNKKQYGGSLSLDAKISRKLHVGIKLDGGFSSTDGFFSSIDPYAYALKTSRAIPCFDENGKRTFYGYRKNQYAYKYNILNELDETGNINDQHSTNAQLKLDYTIIPGLRFESNVGMNITNTAGKSYASEYSHYIAEIRGYEFGEYGVGTAKYAESQLPHGGELNSSDIQNRSFTWRNSLDYNRVFGKHRLSLLLGQECRSVGYQGMSSTDYGYFPDRGKNLTLPPATITTYGTVSPNPLYSQSKIKTKVTDQTANYLSLYGSASYSFDERYILTGSLRSDASNRFGQDKRHRFLPLWSVGGRWNVHNEPWMQRQSVISELALRASYGWQGNVVENFGPELIAQIPDIPIHTNTAEYMLKIKSLGYADLRWEKTKTVNLGADFGLFKNRITVSLEYYQKNTEDMIVYKEVPEEYGITSMPVNGGNMLNQGIELALSGTIIRSKDFVWSFSLNSSKNRNKVDSDISKDWDWRSAVSGELNKRGYPVSSFWVFEFKGLDPNDGSPLFEFPTKEENPEAQFDATVYMKHAGRLEPDFSGGLSTVFRYKSFMLAGSFNLGLGGKKFLYAMFHSPWELPSAYDNLPKELVNRWRKPGDEKITRIPAIPSRLYSYDSGDDKAKRIKLPLPGYQQDEYVYELYNYSDERVTNASFFRCNNLSLSYQFTGDLLKSLCLQNLSLSLAVGNPFIIVSKDYKGVDPEVATGNQPIPRTWSIGLNISF